MLPDKLPMLDVIVPMANPLRWKVRERQFDAFIDQMIENPRVRLTVVECAYGDRPFLYPSTSERRYYKHVGVRARTICWNKECLINLGIKHLPPDWQYLCWPDADILFRDKSWAAETIEALQHYDVVQNWSEAVQLGPHGEFLDMHRSFCWMWMHDRPVSANRKNMWKKDGGEYEYPHPGYSWAARRDALERLGGLFEYGISGSGDHHMALALVGLVDQSVPLSVINACPSLIKRLRVWQDRACHHIRENIGYVRGAIEHNFHGETKNRKYWSRWSIFTDHQFDPDTDLKRNLHGVLELAGNKPPLRRAIDVYMRERAEDANWVT